MMVSMTTVATTRTTRRLALLALGFAVAAVVVQHHGVVAQEEEVEESIQSCADLATAVEDTPLGTTASFVLANDIRCDDYIAISSGQDITISGANLTTTTIITVAADFVADGASQSVLDVQEGGTLTLDGISFVQEEQDSAAEGLPAEGVRAIYNMGTLTVNNCAFDGFNILAADLLSEGGAIYTNSDEKEVVISGSSFTSNFATQTGGAICAVGTDVLTVDGCQFSNNEASAEDAGAGGDIFALRSVTLTVASSTFNGSVAGYGGAAIECCGATISDCQFVAAETTSSDEHFGAVLVGRPGKTPCPQNLVLTDSKFTDCIVSPSTGAGGSVAVFDTSANISDCTFEGSQGTAVLFESSSPNGGHTISMTSSYFSDNAAPADAYAGGGTAVVVKNIRLAEGDEAVTMGQFNDLFCFENDPYECEFVLDLANITPDGEIKCGICSISGTSTRDSPSGNGLITGLVIALAGSVTFMCGFMVLSLCTQDDEPKSSAGAQAQPEPEMTAKAKPVGQPPHVAQSGTAAPSILIAETSR